MGVSKHQVRQENQADNNTQAEGPRVLLAVKLVENPDNAKAIQNWILEAPRDNIKVENMYRSYSDLLLVEVPVAVWDLIPQSPAITFVGFTRGGTSMPPAISNQNLNMSTTASNSSIGASLLPRNDIGYSMFPKMEPAVEGGERPEIPGEVPNWIFF